jgi:hypothetical protein
LFKNVLIAKDEFKECHCFSKSPSLSCRFALTGYYPSTCYNSATLSLNLTLFNKINSTKGGVFEKWLFRNYFG